MSHHAIELEGAWVGRFGRITGSLGVGFHTLLAPETQEEDELVELLAGLRAPKRGRVEVGGHAPSGSPDTRARIGALLRREPPPSAANATESVEQFVQGVLRARSDPRSPSTLLAEFGLDEWRYRPMGQLHSGELRLLAQGLALGTPNPVLMVLHEPLAGIGAEASIVLKSRLLALSETTCVLCVTSSQADANLLGGTRIRLRNGRLETAGHEHSGYPRESAHVTVELRTREARRLVAALTRSDRAISGVSWDEQAAPNTVTLQGHPARHIALSIARLALQERIPLDAVRVRFLDPPPRRDLAALADNARVGGRDA